MKPWLYDRPQESEIRDLLEINIEILNFKNQHTKHHVMNCHELLKLREIYL